MPVIKITASNKYGFLYLLWHISWQRIMNVGFIQALRNNTALTLSVAIASVFFSGAAAHGVYGSLLWNNNGWGLFRIGILFGTSLAAEFVFLLVYKTSVKTEKQLLLAATLAILVTVLRWLFTGYFIDNYAVQIVMQALHAYTFTAIFLVTIALITRFSKKENFESWQSFLFLCGQGIMPAIVIGVAGYFFGRYGVYYYYFLTAYTLTALPVLFLLARQLLGDPKNKAMFNFKL